MAIRIHEIGYINVYIYIFIQYLYIFDIQYIYISLYNIYTYLIHSIYIYLYTIFIHIWYTVYIYIRKCIRNIIGIETLPLGNLQNAHSVRSCELETHEPLPRLMDEKAFTVQRCNALQRAQHRYRHGVLKAGWSVLVSTDMLILKKEKCMWSILIPFSFRKKHLVVRVEALNNFAEGNSFVLCGASNCKRKEWLLQSLLQEVILQLVILTCAVY